MTPFLKGFILGLGTIALIGPVFFTLIKNAVQYGRNAGIWTALGIIVSDIIVFLICFFGTSSILEQIKSEPIVKFAGAAILLAMGLKFIVRPVLFDTQTVETSKKDYLGYFTQGFLVNGVNPFVFIVWIGFITIGRNNYQTTDLYIFLISILLGIFAIDLLKSILADKIKPFLNPKSLKLSYKIIGLILIGFSIRLIIYGIGDYL
ncbi:LysE family translocator [Bacteroidia bacterium]|nr:LysE family translocator [Bacteroidia bacterium]